MADKQVVSQVSGYMDALREKSLARKKKELEQLAATAEIAKQLGEPGWEALMGTWSSAAKSSTRVAKNTSRLPWLSCASWRSSP